MVIAERAAKWETEGSPQKKMHQVVFPGSVRVFDNGGDTQAAIFGEMSCNLVFGDSDGLQVIPKDHVDEVLL